MSGKPSKGKHSKVSKRKSKPQSSDEEAERASSSDSDVDRPDPTPPAKKGKTSNVNADGDPSWDLGNMKHITVREFKGKTLIDIREFYQDASGDTKPGKKGISLNPAQFKKLKETIDEVDAAVQQKA